MTPTSIIFMDFPKILWTCNMWISNPTSLNFPLILISPFTVRPLLKFQEICVLSSVKPVPKGNIFTASKYHFSGEYFKYILAMILHFKT